MQIYQRQGKWLAALHRSLLFLLCETSNVSVQHQEADGVQAATSEVKNTCQCSSANTFPTGATLNCHQKCIKTHGLLILRFSNSAVEVTFLLKKKGGGGAVSKKFMVWKFTQAIRLNFSEACLWGCIIQASHWVSSQHWLLIELADKKYASVFQSLSLSMNQQVCVCVMHLSKLPESRNQQVTSWWHSMCVRHVLLLLEPKTSQKTKLGWGRAEEASYFGLMWLFNASKCITLI